MIYRRIDDDFLDPTVFRKDSVLGVPGIMEAYRQGNVNLANAIGTGVADDKVTYYYVPKMIKFYLGEEPILPNVETYLSADDSDRQFILENLGEKLVVKAANESGGYRMLIGPHAAASRSRFRAAVLQIRAATLLARGQTLALPLYCGGGVEVRHIDLRPYILCCDKTSIIPGGLTRVALRRFAGRQFQPRRRSKDTWVVDEEDVPPSRASQSQSHSY